MRTPRRTPDPAGGTVPPNPGAPARGRRAHAGPPADERPDAKAPSEPAPPKTPARGRSWWPRPRTVRAKIVCLLMVPVVSLLALWGYATVSTAQDMAHLRQLQRVDAQVRGPVDTAITALQAERAAAVRYATKPAPDRGSELERQAGRTDRAVAKLRRGEGQTVADGADLPTGVESRLETFVSQAEGLSTVRSDVLDRRTAWDATYGQYTKTISAAFGVGGALTGIQEAELGSHARVLLEFSRAAEMLAREDVVLSSARLDGSLDGERLRQFTGAVETRRTLTDAAVADLRGPERAGWQDLVEGSAYADVRAVEDKVLVAPPGRKAAAAAPAAEWDSAHAEVRDELRAIDVGASRSAADRADPFTRGLLTPAGAAVLLGLLAVTASLVISVRIGRGLVVELVSLRNGALEIARHKLPDAMRKLRSGEEIDIHAEAPPGPPAEDETGQVYEALGTVHRAALRAAIERAELASGISGVFVNLARRSQVLVHRQLSLLDSMERRSDDPNELSDLFRLDHLTTRMRRHAESLIILSGAAPGRAWRMPVSLTNVVRAAVSEVEDYARVEVRQLPAAAVVGTAVADLTHLLAELVENAAQFSPPHTKVRVNGEPVGNGYALEIEDRGLGMGTETLADANHRIEQSETLDLFDSDQLGLFVVSRLAARNGVKVHLRTSPYGGTTAVVLLPTALLQSTTPESPGAHTMERDRTQDGHARVPDPAPMNGNSVPAPAARPALAPSTETPVTTPPGVTALRLHKPPDAEPDSAPEPSDDLPRRVRQASLAPQLRERPPDDVAGSVSVREDTERSPEQVRDRMAAYRDGWTRGGGRRPGIVGAVPDIPGPAPASDSTEGDHA
ncbi:nitrate- and nitrite sensing domain-containing protein [Streptomyces durmitorensis]|uniref:histidine kinase n=1 Tax=Streptomyces durmitorensis TaxID=319947 RepID=A0ABY4Q5A1_9ACTN|nr:nitrate- and nitrite sensing domain-containing protein [Streptomyces durmitorensis]UQT60824.1 nitrate- and nitrite sensing domain-containing protein [Streptomyces durmitorensis]